VELYRGHFYLDAPGKQKELEMAKQIGSEGNSIGQGKQGKPIFVFLPDDHTVVLLDADLPAPELIQSINSGQWEAPVALAKVLKVDQLDLGKINFKAAAFGNLVVAFL
jgi:hypothetical protein